MIARASAVAAWMTRPSDAFFSLVHGRHLVYNTCWEDPRLDREALRLSTDDRVLMITSAGCNALDYALDEPRQIWAVDVNPRQTALLELKQAAIRSLDFEDMFELFGRGRHADWDRLYPVALRPQLSGPSREFWDRKGHYFSGRGLRPSFYFHGAAGSVAHAMNQYIDHVVDRRSAVTALLSASTIDEQREIYDVHLRSRLWAPWLLWLARQPGFLALLAVPRAQRDHLERDYPGGISDFIAQRVETVFTRLPLRDNYFWRVYLTGQYTNACCPAYLTADGFRRLKDGLVDRITAVTATVQDHLGRPGPPLTRFVLLDHMDWLCDRPGALAAEWQQLLGRAAPGARIIWRSGGRGSDIVESLVVTRAGRLARLGELLTFARDQAAELHERDRVHTYASFHIATLTA